jgi:hypothetical protein
VQGKDYPKTKKNLAKSAELRKVANKYRYRALTSKAKPWESKCD